MKRSLQVFLYTFFFLTILISSEAQQCQPGQQRVCGYDTIGECRSGVQLCENGQWSTCLGTKGPTPEACNDGKDNDCDGQTDEQCECTSGQTRPCGSTENIGICKKGTQRCEAGQWGPCLNATNGLPTELCGTSGEGNQLDDNCNGQVDEGCQQLIQNRCFNNIQDPVETGVDCGGPCRSCATCTDRLQNQGEKAVDCGGPCPPCPSCDDGIQNQNEQGIDCGGPCPACIRLEETDEDNDGLTYREELKKGTDPRNSDTDDDQVKDKQDTLPLCPNNFCDTSYGETTDTCPQDCKKPAKFPWLVFLIIFLSLFLLFFYFYRNYKKSTLPKQTRGTVEEPPSPSRPSFDAQRYKSLQSQIKHKEVKSKVEKDLEKSFDKVDTFLKKS